MIRFFCNHKNTVSIFLSIFMIIGIQITSYADVTPVTDRTSQVRDAIVAAAGVNTADEVTETHLTAITSLNLRNAGISELQSGDFSGLTGLTNLNLYGNQLSSLPDGIFEGLTALTTLRLGGNTVDPLPIAVSLERVEDGQFKAVVPIGAPYDIVIPISATNGSIADSATTFTISKGSTSSDTLTVTRTVDTTTAVTANIGTLPNLPSNHYGYMLTKSDTLPLEVISAVPDTTPVDPTPVDPVDPVDPIEPIDPIEPETPTNTAPTFTDGTITIRSIAENTPANTNIGSVVSATDVNEDDTLTYTLGGTDAASFDIDSTTGQLKTKAALDYETKRVYIITITATDGTLTDTISVIISIIDVADTSIATTTLPVSNRTPEVRDAIVAAVPNITDAADVTDTHLATITSLNLRNAGIAALKTGDFGGLTALTSINLYGNMLNSLPVRIFEGLTSLTSLRLGGNAVDPMPLAVSLQQVDVNQFKAIIPTGAPFDVVLPINGASITAATISKGSLESVVFTATTDVYIGTLPASPSNHFGYILAKSNVCNRTFQVSDAIVAAVPGITDCRNVTEVHLATITSLDLSGMGIASLDAGDFAGMLSLTTLNLNNNQLSSLPDGIFEDLTSLTTLNLNGNSVDPVSLLVSLEKVGTNQVKAVVPTGAPFDITLPITVANGSLIGNVTTITIPAGSVESQLLTVIRTANTSAAVTLDISSLPSLPDGHTGYALTKSAELPVEIFSSTNTAPVFTEGTTATRTIDENIATGTNIGTPVSATDANNDILTYTLSGTDAAEFNIDSETGQLKTKTSLDYETKSSYSVTITVSDGSLSDTITVTISVTDVNENRAPVFTEGSSATRTVAENTAPGVNIGTPISATDANNDILTYTLSGTDTASYDIDDTTGQLKTKAALDYETKSSYSVTITVSDGSLSDTINVTISVTDVNENRAPVFTEGSSATRTVAENTAPGVNIGTDVAATDADNDTLFYSLGGTDATSYDIDSETGQLKTKAALDYETKSSYSVTITVSDGNGGSDTITVTINITDINEVDTTVDVKDDIINKVPMFSDGETATRSITENTGSGVDIGAAVAATDADNDTLTYNLEGTDAAKFSIDSSSGQLRTRAALDYEIKTSYSVTITVSDGNGGSDSIIVTITITDVDERPTNIAPEFTDGSSTTRAIAENTGSGIDIGTPIVATDADADTLTYTLDGADAAAFSINSTNGQLRTSAALDYETKSSYTLTVSVSDGNGGSDSIIVTITITDVDERPSNITPEFTDGSSTTRAVAENTGAGVDIDTPIAATDADADTLIYTLDGTDAAAFSINSTNGQLRTSAALDYETKSSYTLTVSVSDGNGGSDSIIVTITITDVDERPTNIAPEFTDGSSTTRAIAENIGTGVDIGTPIAATDADADTLAYSLGGTDAASFNINSANGQLRTSASLDYETKSSYTVTITVSDGNGGSDSITVTITITDVDETPANNPPVFTEEEPSRSIAENTNANVDIGSPVTATDEDNQTLNYSLTGTDADSFDIVSTTGQLKTKAALNHEAKDSYMVTVNVSDGQGGSDSVDVTIEVTDVNEAPVFADGSSTTRTIAENAGANINIGSAVSATDVDANTTLTYSLGGTNAAAFDIEPTTGQLKTKAALDYETKNSYTVIITVSDSSLTDTIIVTITIRDLDETPSNIAPVLTDGETTIRSVPENTATDTDIGTPIAATDEDSTTLAYLLSGTDASTFSIDEETGQLKTSAALNYEDKTSYSLTVTVSDGSLDDEISVTINVTNVNESPVFADGENTTRRVTENTDADENFGRLVSAIDPDTDDTLTYSLVGTDAASFDIESTTGQLKTKAALDFETKESYSVTVKVADSGALSDTIAVTINVRDVDENRAPIFTDGETATRTVAENTGAGVDIGDPVAATDADNDTLQYTLGGIDAGAFSIGSTTGQLRTKDALDYEDTQSYTVTITVSDGNNASDTITVTINVTDVDENRAPVFTDGETATRAVAENTGSGVDIGNPVAATDADNDTLQYTLGGTDAGTFNIGSTTGQLRTKDALDFEDTQSYTVTITVSDGNNASDTIAVTINVTDVDENRAPVFTDGETATRAVAENTGSGVDIGTPVAATDADNDTLEYSLGGTDNAAFSIDSTTGQLRTNAPLDYEDKPSYSVTITVSDGNNASDTIAVTINVTDEDENRAPVFTDGETATRAVAENTGTGVDIGNPVAATDADNDTLEYTLGGTDAAAFSIDSTSGQLKTKDSLNYEDDTSYTMIITVSDGSLEDEITVTINVSDANDAPVFSETAPVTRAVDENTAAEQNIGTPISATDEDSDTLEYSLGGTDASSFSIVSTSGQLQTKAALDYEDDDAYTVTVTVTDDSGSSNNSASIDVTIDVTDVFENSAPTFTVENFAYEIDDIEAASVGDNIGDALTATDTDNDTLAYSVGGDDASKFAVDSSGQLTVTQALLDDTRTNYSFKVIADDGNGGMAEVSGTVRASGRVSRQLSNNRPVFSDGTSTTRAIPENTASGENIGDAVSATDADTSDTVTYTLEGTDAASFSIVSTSGQLQTSASLDYETKTSYSVTVKATDDSAETNASATIAVTITVTDVDEGSTTVGDRSYAVRTAIIAAIPGVTSAADVTAEHLAAITSLNLSATNITLLQSGDFDGLTGLRRLDLDFNEISSVPAGIFDDLTSLRILEFQSSEFTTLPTGLFDNLTSLTTLDFDANRLSSLPLGIFENLTSLTKLDLSYNDLTSIPEGLCVNLTSLTTLYLDGNPVDPLPLPITLEKVQDSEFKAVAITGAPFDINVPVTVSNGTISGGATNVTISKGSTDSETLTVTRTPGTTDDVTVTIGNLPGRPSNHLGYTLTKGDDLNVFRSDNTAPVFAEGTSTTRLVRERTNSGVNIGDPVSATDADNDRLTYTLGGTDETSFSIQSNTGQLQTNETLDYETKTSYSVTVSVSDGYGGSASITVTINITDIDETPLSVPLSDRTGQVRDAIIGAIPNVHSADDVFNGDIEKITELDLFAQNITSLNADDFDGLIGLTTLNLEDNEISSLPAGIFDGLTALTTLNLEDNEISSLSEGIFDGLTALTTLDLDGNGISSLLAGIFDELTVLTWLGLNYNNLSSLPSGIFDELTALLSLDLYNNSLTSLPSGIFDNNDKLTDLAIYNNNISSLDSDVFNGLTNVQTIHCANNKITSLPGGLFANNDKLEKLYLYNNEISSMAGNTLTGATNLEILEMYSNKLTSFPDGFFVGITKLTRIDFSENTDDHLDIYISLRKVADGQVQTVCPTGTPMLAGLHLSISNGGRAPHEPTEPGFTIPLLVDLQVGRGETESGLFDIVRKNNNAVKVDNITIYYKPNNADFFGIVYTEVEDNIPLEVLPAVAGAPENTPNLPDKTAFLPNFPNPFNPETWIPYQLATPADVTLTIYDIRGVVVRELTLGHQPAGYYTSRKRSAHWDGRNNIGEKVAAGVYFCTIKAGDYTATRKMLIRK